MSPSPDPGRVAALALEDRGAESALELARFAHPDLDPRPYLDLLVRLAGGVEGTTHLALRRCLAIREGFGGNVDDYDNLENCFLDRVLDTRRGIPVTLSLVWIEVGRRAGLEMEGVGLPGHFLVYAAGQLVDPFHYGEAIGRDEAADLVAKSLGGPPRVDPAWLEPVSISELVARILRNLDRRYEAAGAVPDWVGACLGALVAKRELGLGPTVG